MAEALTYNSLLSDVQLYAERNDEPFITQIPRFVMLAENRLASEVRGLGIQKFVTGNLSSPVLEKPQRWRETVSFGVVLGGERVYLQQRTYEYCREFSNGSNGPSPRYYSDYGYEHFYVTPVTGSVAFELAYYERPEPLSTANQTNWITQYSPQLLLYATLLEAQPFLKRPERIAEFQAMYDRALQGLAQETTRRIGSDRASTTRTGE